MPWVAPALSVTAVLVVSSLFLASSFLADGNEPFNWPCPLKSPLPVKPWPFRPLRPPFNPPPKPPSRLPAPPPSRPCAETPAAKIVAKPALAIICLVFMSYSCLAADIAAFTRSTKGAGGFLPSDELNWQHRSGTRPLTTRYHMSNRDPGCQGLSLFWIERRLRR